MPNLFVLISQNPLLQSSEGLLYLASANSYGELEPHLLSAEKRGVDESCFLIVVRFVGEKAEALQSKVQLLVDAKEGDRDSLLDQIEALLAGYLFPAQEGESGEAERDEFDESMDGDHESALASAGFGTDEDYGCFGGDFGDD